MPSTDSRISGVLADHLQHFGAKMADKLLSQNRADSLDEASAQVPLDALDCGRRRRLQRLGLELQPVLFIPDPPTPAGEPLSGADRRHRAQDRNQVPLPADLHPEHGESAFFVEKGHALDKARDLFGRGAGSWR